MNFKCFNGNLFALLNHLVDTIVYPSPIKTSNFRWCIIYNTDSLGTRFIHSARHIVRLLANKQKDVKMWQAENSLRHH